MKLLNSLINDSLDGNRLAQTISYIILPIVVVGLMLFIIHVSGIADTIEKPHCKYSQTDPK